MTLMAGTPSPYARHLIILGLVLLSILTPLLALGYGAVSISLSDIIAALTPLSPAGHDSDSAFHAQILREIRLPRVLLGVVAGAALGLSGAMLQTLFRNPLADPGLIGTAAGAALAGAVAMILVQQWLPDVAAFLGLWLVPLFAFAGAMLALLIVLRLAGHNGHLDPAHLLLAGIAINALVGAGIGLLVYIASDDQLRNFTVWTLGTLAGAHWTAFGLLAAVCALTLALTPWLTGPLNALLLSEGDARCLGYRVPLIKLVIMLLAALCVGASVAFCGIIGFIGLMVPNLMRLVVGPDHRWLLPASGLCGAIVLTLSDLAARVVIAPAELPIGILTALIGAPFFILLLRRRVREAAHA